MKRKLFSLLVLLLTAVTGAWADATIAKLWVGNSEEVTSEGTITGTGATEGTASVAIENGSMVLTLNNFKFTGCGHNDSGIYYQSNTNGNTPLIIKIEGDNEITLPGDADKSLYGLFLYGGNGDHVFTITGSGSLTVTVGDGNLSNGIFVQQADLVLAGGTVTANVGNAGADFKSLGVSVPQGTLTIDGCTLKASGSTTSASRGVNVNNNVTIKSGELEAYGYSKGIKNSGGDALVFAEGVTPTLFKAGDNEASATDVSKYEGQKYLHVVCTGGDEPATDDTTVFELNGSEATTGTLTLGTSSVEASTVKIHTNTDNVAGIKFSSSYSLADGKYFTIAPATGSFKAGDKLTIAVCFNNADDTKTAKAVIYAADGETLLYTTDQGINGRTMNDDPKVEEYVLTQDAEKLYFGRNGNTATFVTTLKVVRPAGDAPAPAGDGVDYNLTVGENAHGTITFKVGDETVTKAKQNDVVTVTITPDAGWSTGSIKGLWYAATGAAKAPKRAQSNIDLLKDFELEPVEGNPNAFTFVMKRANAEISVSYRKLLTHADISFEDIAAVTYTGQALTPTVTVKDGQTVLTKDTDYSVSYESNENVGTGKATIVGIGLYSGQVEKTFTINKADITPTAPTAMTQLTFNGQAQTLVAAGSITGPGNMEACEMQYSLDGQTYAKELPTAVNTGSYTVFYKVVGDANHNGVDAQFINVAIYKAALTNVLLEASTLTYNQQEQSPTITSVKAGTLDVPAEAYTISGNKATNVGNYLIEILPKDDAQNYDGSAKAQWSIVAANANLFTIQLANSSLVYNGTEQKPAATVKDGETVLVEGTDYTLTYTNNVNVGTATVTATGIGNYTGTQTKEFAITKADMVITAPAAISGLVYTTQAQALANAGTVEGGELMYSLDNTQWTTTVPTGTEAKEYTVYYKIVNDANHKAVEPQQFKVTIDKATLTAAQLTETNFVYNQQEQTVLVSYVNAGTIVVPATSYDVEGNKATNVGNYEAKMTGKGNFKGEVKVQWSIVAANAQLFDITLGTTEYIYDGNAKTPTATVKDGEATLVENTDYTLAYTANTAAGTATVTATGKGNYTGTQTATFVIKPAKLTSVTLAQTEFQYNLFEPVAQTAGIVEVKAGNLIVPAAQYEVKGNTQTEPGEYIVTVTGKTNFTDSVTAKFVILDQVVDGDAEKTETEEKVDDIDMKVTVVDRSKKKLQIDEITEATPSGDNLTVTIPATINGWSVASITAGAMAGMNNVTDIYMPDTEEPIQIEADALSGLATIHTSLALLDDYALMAGLKDNYEGAKVVCTVTPVNKYWTLGTGCDVIIPDGIDVYTVQVKNSAEVATEIIPEDMLKFGNERIVKANNGVLLLGTAGQSYDLVAYSGRIASGMPVATSDNKDYGQKNCLEPVVEKKHYDSGHYFVLQNNQFHSILAEGDEVKVPAGKAVLHLGNEQAGANARVLKIDDSTTGISHETYKSYETYDWYDLSGRKLDKMPIKKGLYIINGKKVVVK